MADVGQSCLAHPVTEQGIPNKPLYCEAGIANEGDSGVGHRGIGHSDEWVEFSSFFLDTDTKLLSRSGFCLEACCFELEMKRKGD